MEQPQLQQSMGTAKQLLRKQMREKLNQLAAIAEGQKQIVAESEAIEQKVGNQFLFNNAILKFKKYLNFTLLTLVACPSMAAQSQSAVDLRRHRQRGWHGCHHKMGIATGQTSVHSKANNHNF